MSALKLPLFLSRKLRSNALTGIVPGEDGVAAATVAYNGQGKPALEFCRFVEFGEEVNLEKALNSLVHDSGAGHTPCTTVMPHNDYQLVQVEAPDVPPAELRAAVRWHIKELIDFHIDDAVIDVFEIPGQRPGQARGVFAVAARIDKLRERIDLLEKAGARLEIVDLEEMALRNLATGLSGDGCTVLRFNEDHGLITICQDGNLFLTRRIETGAMSLFSAAQQADPENDDYGSELTALLEGVTLEIQRSLDYYDSHFSQPPVGRLVVVPSVLDLPFVPGYFDKNLSMEARELELGELIEGELPEDRLERARCLTAIGAAMRSEEPRS